MSYKAVAWAFEHGPDNASDLLVLVALAEYADPHGLCFPSMKTLAAKCRMSERGTRYIIRRLTQAGYLSVEIGSWKEGSSRYRLLKRNRMSGAPHAPGGGAPDAPPAPDAPLNDMPQAGHDMPQGGAPDAPKPVNEPVNEPSDPNGSGTDGAETVDFIKEVFDRGVMFLGRYGTADRPARSLIGKWRQQAGDTETFNALRDAQREGVTEPVAWITARLKPKADQSDALKAIFDQAVGGPVQ